MARTIDLYLVYQFIRRLVTPFDQTKAFKLGIINKDGHVLKKRESLTTDDEKNAYTYFDTLVFNLKKLINKLGGKNKIITYAAALLLLREQNNPSKYIVSEEKLEKRLNTQLKIMGKMSSKTMSKIFEEGPGVGGAPANNVGAGRIAGTLDNPTVVRKKPVMARRKIQSFKKFRQTSK